MEMNGKKAKDLRLESNSRTEYQAFKAYYRTIALRKSQNPKPLAERKTYSRPMRSKPSSNNRSTPRVFVNPVAQLKKLANYFGTAFIRDSFPHQVRWLISGNNAFRHTGIERILQRLARPLIEQTLRNALNTHPGN